MLEYMKKLPFLGMAALMTPLSQAGEETRLISLPTLDTWTPPVKKEVVLEPKQVIQRSLLTEGGRKVSLERCAKEVVVRENTEGDETITEEEDTSKVEDQGNYLSPLMAGVSASVYKEGEKTYSKVQVTCGQTTVTAWSTVDFNHFRGVTSYIANGREYYQVGGYGDVRGMSASEVGCPVNAPELNGEGDGFIVTSPGGIDETNVAYIALFDMHTLYAQEKELLAKAYAVRLENMELSRKWHEANPPQPQDITVRFWKREIVEEAK